MAKRLYYDCAMQALYMLKNFGIAFETYEKFPYPKPNGQKEEFEPFENYVTDEAWANNCGTIVPAQLINLDIGKIYVKKESESIFELKTDDIGITANGDICVFTGERWLINAGKRYIEPPFAHIIFRGKHFFMPKQENNDQ